MHLSSVKLCLQLLNYQGSLCWQHSVGVPRRDGGLVPTPASAEEEWDRQLTTATKLLNKWRAKCWHTPKTGNVYLTVNQVSIIFHVLHSARDIFYKAKLDVQFGTESGFAAHLGDFLSLHLDQWIIHKYFVLQPEAQIMFLVHTVHQQTKMD